LALLNEEIGEDALAKSFNQSGSFSTNDSPNRLADYQAYYNCLRFNDKWSEQLAYLSKASSR